MDINELVNIVLKELALDHKQVVSYQVGNTFDVATSKSSEKYPAIWTELPIIIDYPDRRKKQYGFALNFLTLAKTDDITDEMYKTSDMEIIADEFLQALDDKYRTIGISGLVGLTLRNFSDDDLVGVRVDVKFNVGRACDYKENFNTVI